MPGGHDTTIEVSNIMSFVLYTQILKQSVLKPASPGITLTLKNPPYTTLNNNQKSFTLFVNLLCTIIKYSDDLLIRAPIVRKSR